MPLIPNEKPIVTLIKDRQTTDVILPNGLNPSVKEVILIKDSNNELSSSTNILSELTYNYTSSLNASDITKGYLGFNDVNVSGSGITLSIHENSIFGDNIDFALDIFSGSVTPTKGYVKIKNSTSFEDYISYSINDIYKDVDVWILDVDKLNQNLSFNSKTDSVVVEFMTNVDDISISYNGNRNITRTTENGELIVSGSQNLQSSDIVAFLDDYFFPYRTAEVNIRSLNNTDVYETGSVIDYDLNINIINHSDTIFQSGSLYRNNVAIASYSSSNAISFDFTDLNVQVDSTYQYRLNSGTGSVYFNAINSNSISSSFVYPILWCSSPTKLTDNQSIYQSAKLSGSFLLYSQYPTESFIRYSSINSYHYVAIPDTALNVTIKDEHGFVIHSPSQSNWTDISKDIQSTGLTNNWTQSYQIYESNLTNIDALWKIIIS